MSQTIWFVCSGVDISHMWDAKPCKSLREAKLYAEDLPKSPIGTDRPFRIEKWEYPAGRDKWDTAVQVQTVFKNYGKCGGDL